ncbi:MAG: hypothetical protein RL678_1174 [Pseudomonadota bacterium]|jgi:alcohol dehydrogenase class IV
MIPLTHSLPSFGVKFPNSIIAEFGVAARLGQLVRGLAQHKILVVTDKFLYQSGLLNPALTSLRAEGFDIAIFSDVVADPPTDVIHRAVAAAVDIRCDCVIGLGGGSSMDVAKLVAVLAPGKETLDAIYGVDQAKGPRLPLVLVPTTAGTGSEVTQISIVTTGAGEKRGVVSPILLPDLAILDAQLTLNLPPAVTAATGIDAMVHAIEAYTSKRLKNPVSDLFALESLRLLSANIVTACREGHDVNARQAMLVGAMLAGLAFANAPVGGVHALAYPIGARFHVPHGLSNSLVLPAVLRFNLPAAQQAYTQIAAHIFPEDARVCRNAEGLVDWLSALPRTLGLPVRLTEVGIQASDLTQLASDAMLQTRLLINNPRELGLDEAYRIYEEVL